MLVMWVLTMLVLASAATSLLHCDIQHYVAAESVGQEMGYSVTSIDNLVVSGNPRLSVRPLTPGVVHVFDRDSSELLQTLSPFGKHRGLTFGFSVSLVSRGSSTILLVGAPYAGGTPGVSFPGGLVYVFAFNSSSSMFQPAQLLDFHQGSAQVGHASASLGDTAWVSALQLGGSGGVYQLSMEDHGVTVDHVLLFPLPPGVGFQWFGYALSVSSSRLLVNARNFNGTGAVLQYSRGSGASWPEYLGVLPQPPGLPRIKLFGSGLSVSPDASLVAVGTPLWGLGVVHVYSRGGAGDSWTIAHQIDAPSQSPGNFGESLRFHNDTTLYIGDLQGVAMYRLDSGASRAQLVAVVALHPGRDDAVAFGPRGIIGWPRSGQTFRFRGCSALTPTEAPPEQTSLPLIAGVTLGVLVLVSVFATVSVLWWKRNGRKRLVAEATEIHDFD